MGQVAVEFVPRRMALPTLLEVLLDAVEGHAAPDLVRTAVEQLPGDADADRLFELAAPAVGLRLRPLRAPLSQVRRLVRPDLPIVTGTDHGWVVLTEERFGRLAVRDVPHALGPRWVRPADLLGGPDAVHVFWLVEPAAPAGPLALHTDDPWRRLSSLLWTERDDLRTVAIYAVALGVLSLATPVAIQVLINWLAFGALAQPVLVVAGVLLVVLLAAAALRALKRSTVEVLQRRVFVRTVGDIAHRLTRVKISAFDTRHGPELINRWFDVFTVQKAVAKLLLDGLAAVLQALVGLALLGVYHPALLAFDVVLVACLVGVIVGLGRNGAATAIEESKAKYAVASWLEELARHPVVFKLGGGEALALSRTEQLARAWLDRRVAHFAVFFRQFLGAQGVTVVASAGLLALCGWLVLTGELTLGQLVAAEFIVASSLAGFAKVTDTLDTVYDLIAGVDKLGELVDLPLEPLTGRAPLAKGPAAVRVDGLTYAYPDGPPVLASVDLDVVPGGSVAILGPEGAGKSLLAELLCGVRTPTRGTVRLDGLDMRELRPDIAQRDIVLLRGPEVVWGSLRDNVTLRRPDVDPQTRDDAIARAGLTASVARLSDGLDTVLGPTGAPLAAWETRRLVLARALAGRPRLVVVDGLLDGLDAAERDLLLGTLRQSCAGITLVVLTADDRVADVFPRSHTIEGGRLHAR